MVRTDGKPEKVAIKKRLFSIAVQALEADGWKVERERGSGKSSVRRITKNRQSKLVTIRTSQDTWIAFPRTAGDKSWRTLDEVDAVVPVSIDDPENPKFAKVHMIEGDEVRSRFNRAYKARMDAKRSIPVGRGVWVSLYHQEAKHPVSYVGAGMGIKFPPIATIPFSSGPIAAAVDEGDQVGGRGELRAEPPLSISEAKRRLAITFGVGPANIKITVEA